MKTLIELFDPCRIKNVIAGLSFKPEKIVFIGFKQNMKKDHLNAMERFFRMKNLNICMEYEYVSRYNYNSITERLQEIIDKNEDCCFDLTGGRELILVAMGELCATKNIPAFQFDIKSGNLIHVKNCKNIPLPKKESLSIEECVTLNGGAVVKAKKEWKMDKDFCEDILSMWNVCRSNINEWNSNSSALAAFDKNDPMGDSLRVSCKIRENGKHTLDDKIMAELTACGVIKDYRQEKGILSFAYKNEQIRRALTKAGNVLELVAYMLSREISAEENNFYNDIDVGVMVDWDGIVNGDIRTTRDTRNEIDVFLMHGHIPVFISCKNGSVQKEALYELEAVGDKFGGEFSKKVLLTTYINRNRNARNFIIQRARDMNIEIIEGIDKMSVEELKKVLAQRAR